MKLPVVDEAKKHSSRMSTFRAVNSEGTGIKLQTPG